jgi:hypothetical protein
VVGCTYPGAVSAKAGQGGARERAEDLVAIHSHPSCSTDPAGNPTNEHHQERGHEAGGEKGSLGWRRRRALGAGGVDGDEDGEGQPAHPPTSSAADGRPPARRAAGFSLALARSLS